MTKREEVLNEALKCVTKDRNASYGEPEDNFQHIADLWNAHFKIRRKEFTFSPADVAIMFVLMKVARTRTSPDKLDNAIDGAGYFACYADCVGKPSAPIEIKYPDLWDKMAKERIENDKFKINLSYLK